MTHAVFFCHSTYLSSLVISSSVRYLLFCATICSNLMGGYFFLGPCRIVLALPLAK